MKTIIITGSAGFIGFHLSKSLLRQGFSVVGVDSLDPYYDVNLKQHRQQQLMENTNFHAVNEKIQKPGLLMEIFRDYKPNIVIHLAAQAGVRYSIDNPRVYLETNIVGTFELLEAAKVYPPEHMLLASTSSAYGANDDMPYSEGHISDHQISFYAATKKSTENMAHSYAHLYNLPITMFRFFTVYGPLGRPDMALFKFTKNIFEDQPIDIYNNGDMLRDFTYIDDLVHALMLLVGKIPSPASRDLFQKNDSISPVAPFRVINIGNSKPEKLMDFVSAIEDATGKQAIKNYMAMQPGDVPATWADCSLLSALTGYKPSTSIREGVEKFVSWYVSYFHKH
jgi:UDP-glucuronate 4-epimerase